MAKIQFDAKYRQQIESGEYKVETGAGYPVTILDWSFHQDSGQPYLCVKITLESKDIALLYSKDGKRITDERVKDTDLFIITPDLEESEDERIRLDIVALINFAIEDGSAVSPGSHTTKEDALRYLEKQKEQKSVEWSEEEKERIRQNGRLDVCYNPKKYGLCNKTVWGEEDSRILEEAIDMIGANGCWVRSDDTVKQVVTFLKSIPERFNIQPKQEWSEEDEKMLEVLISNYKFLSKKYRDEEKDFFCSLSIVRDDLTVGEWFEKRIKSLRPQPHWRPSEEQMMALEIACKAHPETITGERILSLLIDLKKL